MPSPTAHSKIIMLAPFWPLQLTFLSLVASIGG